MPKVLPPGGGENVTVIGWNDIWLTVEGFWCRDRPRRVWI